MLNSVSHQPEPSSEARSAADTAPVITAPRAHHSSDLFLGPLGLRAGWGIALYLVLALILALTAVTVFSQFSGARTSQQHASTKHLPAQRTSSAAESSDGLQSSSPSPAAPKPASTPIAAERAKDIALNDGALLLGVVASALILARLERRSAAVYGLGPKHLADIVPGALAGLLLLSLLVALLHALQVLAFDGRLLYGRGAWLSGFRWLLTFTLVGLFEEYLFRGYLQYTLTRGLLGLAARFSPENAQGVAFSLAAVLLSLLFSAVHLFNRGETAVGISVVFVAGMVFSYALWRTGSLWWGVGFHLAWDWAQSFLYGVPDSGKLSAGRLLATHPVGRPFLSGGGAGPEGSVFALPALLAIVLLLWMVRPRPQPPLDPQPAEPPANPASLIKFA